MASLLLPSEIPEKCMSRCKTYPANLRTPGGSFLLWKVYSDLSDRGWFAVLREARNKLSGWGCGRALAAVWTSVQPGGHDVVWCSPASAPLSSFSSRFPSMQDVSRYLSDVPLQSLLALSLGWEKWGAASPPPAQANPTGLSHTFCKSCVHAQCLNAFNWSLWLYICLPPGTTHGFSWLLHHTHQ